MKSTSLKDLNHNFLSVKQLIAALSTYPQDCLVLIDGYEDGLDALLSIEAATVEYDETKAWYYGPFEASDQSDIKAVKLISTRGQRV